MRVMYFFPIHQVQREFVIRLPIARLEDRQSVNWLAVGILLGRTTKNMAQLGAQLSQQGKPSAGQMSQMQALRKQQATYSNISAAAVILALIFMAIARYLVF